VTLNCVDTGVGGSPFLVAGGNLLVQDFGSENTVTMNGENLQMTSGTLKIVGNGSPPSNDFELATNGNVSFNGGAFYTYFYSGIRAGYDGWIGMTGGGGRSFNVSSLAALYVLAVGNDLNSQSSAVIATYGTKGGTDFGTKGYQTGGDPKYTYTETTGSNRASIAETFRGAAGEPAPLAAVAPPPGRQRAKAADAAFRLRGKEFIEWLFFAEWWPRPAAWAGAGP
jgi:hypothetical protein